MAELVQDRNGGKRMDKQIGCMSGFLQIFDRQQILAGKRIHSTKRLPPSTGDPPSSETVSSVNSPELSAMPEKSQLLVPILDLKNETDKCSLKSCKQIHRLSLDRKATVDSKGTISPRNNNSVEGDEKQRRSPSVIARLMGLEPLSSPPDSKNPQPVAKPTLGRSASESRVSRDLVHSKYIDGSNFQVKQPNKSQNRTPENSFRDDGCCNVNSASKNLKSEAPKTSSSQQRTRFFDSADFFPEPNQMHRDLEKKMKMRGMDEQYNDLGTLKQILEVLQLKGLLHSSTSSIKHHQQNFVHDRNIPSDESTIILMKSSKNDSQRSAIDSRGGERKYASEDSPTTAAGDRSRRSPVRGRNSSPNRIESNLKSCNSIVKQRPLSIEIQTRANNSSDSLRTTPINSPKLTPKRNGSDSVHYSKQRIIKKAVADDESSSISESTVTTPSTTDTERLKCEEYKGRSTLQRCDKLLYNLEKMNSSKTESPPSSTTVLPSPVSVLDPEFDKDESSSPLYSIDYIATPAVDFEEESWSASILQTKSTEHEEVASNDSDFIYISEIFRASKYLHEDSNVFFSIEKQLYNNKNDTSKVSKRQRKLVFDVIVEIVEKGRQLAPWKVVSFTDSGVSLKQIWSEFQKIREINTGDDLLELISGVLKKDLAGIGDWEDHPVETSEAILDIERMIFKDLVSEAIGDLTEYPGRCRLLRTQRKLVF